MKEDIGEMMSAGMQSIQLAVQHVGKPGQRMPIVSLNAGERPDNSLERQPPGDHWIIIHIMIVVEVNELMAKSLAENDKRDRGQGKTNPRRLPTLNIKGRTFFYWRAFFRKMFHCCY